MSEGICSPCPLKALPTIKMFFNDSTLSSAEKK